MSEYLTIQLKGRISTRRPIEFLLAEVPLDYHNPFARIRYALWGEPQDDGLRLDLGRRVFIDHLEDDEQEEILQAATPKIVQVLIDALVDTHYE